MLPHHHASGAGHLQQPSATPSQSDPPRDLIQLKTADVEEVQNIRVILFYAEMDLL
jgi:hypothetical protein